MKTLPPEDLTYTEHPSDIIAKAAALINAGRPFALITSMAIEGGAAREVGSLALVESNGAMTGYLSNGCIDRDIQLHAQSALERGTKTLIRYGEGSRYVDLKLPCGGALTVLIDPVPDRNAILTAAQDLAARHPVRLQFSAENMSKAFDYSPRDRLVLAGRGAVFRSIAQIGKATGFELHLLSPDPEDLAAIGHLARSRPVHLTTPDQVPELNTLDAFSAFLTLFHDHGWEPDLLRAAVNSPAAFIGSLGSQRTHQMRLDTLRAMGVDESALTRLRGPIGLVPSLRDAPSIAVSALAEVVAALQQTNR